MAKARKDNKGRALRKGESQRSQDNRYMYTYTNFAGKRVYVYALTLQELRQKENDLVRNRLDGLDLYSAEQLDLDTLVDQFLRLRKDISTSTAGNYRRHYDAHCKNVIGKRKVASIKFSDILGLYQGLVDGGMKVATVQILNNALHQSFEMAVRDGIIRTNPCLGVIKQLKRREVRTKTRRALTIEEQTEFIRYVANHPKYRRHKALFVLLLGTGTRIGEAAGLRWEDVDFENRVIDINHAMTFAERGIEPPLKYEYHCGSTKTAAGVRKIPMLDQVYEVLIELYEEQKVSGFSKIVVDGMSGFIFTTDRGRPLCSSTVNGYIHRIRESHNAEETAKAKEENRDPILLPYFTCHCLRHTFCTRFCENETNIKVIQAVMGHNNIQTTMDVYAEVTESKKKLAMEELSKNCKIF